MRRDDPRFQHLLAAVCEGRATDGQVDRLEEILCRDEAARDAYLAYVDLQACLAVDCVGDDAGGRLCLRESTDPARRALPWVSLFVGALVLMVLLAFVRVGRWLEEPGLPYFAVVTNAEGALWEGEDASVMIGTGLGPGTVELCEGRVELEMDTGVQVALEGPARFELLSLNRAILYEGMLSASVPPQGIGFTVETPALELVDLGTRFGVYVASSGEAEVHVFDGEVEATLKGGEKLARKEILTPNLTRRARRNGSSLEPATFRPERFAKPPDVVEGVAEVWGGIRTLRYPPESVSRGTFQHDYILLFLEQKHVELEDPLEVSVVEPGRYRVGFDDQFGDAFRRSLEPGVCVDSYFLHFDTECTRKTHRRATVRFQRPIVAVIAGGEQLASTDELLGSWCTVYDRPQARERQLESDHVIIGGDRRTLTVSWKVGTAADQIRVLVETKR